MNSKLLEEMARHERLLRSTKERVLKLIEAGECQHLLFSVYLDEQLTKLDTMRSMVAQDQKSYCVDHDQFFDTDICPECKRGAVPLEE